MLLMPAAPAHMCTIERLFAVCGPDWLLLSTPPCRTQVCLHGSQPPGLRVADAPDPRHVSRDGPDTLSHPNWPADQRAIRPPTCAPQPVAYNCRWLYLPARACQPPTHSFYCLCLPLPAGPNCWAFAPTQRTPSHCSSPTCLSSSIIPALPPGKPSHSPALPAPALA